MLQVAVSDKNKRRRNKLFLEAEQLGKLFIFDHEVVHEALLRRKN